MPENQVKLIHVFMRKHIEQLVLQTSHNIILIHYKCRGLHSKQSWWGSCIHRCDETEDKHPNSRFLLAADTSFHSFIRLFISLPSPALFKFEIPIRQRQIDVCSAEFTVEELVWCTEPTQNCQGRQTACLLAVASWDITTHVTANGPHPACVCV